MCACWVWGYNNNPDCKKDKFKDDSEGCCWLKRRDDDGGLCAKEASKTHASAQTFGFFGELPHDGGLPDDGSTGWAVVFGLLGIIFAVQAADEARRAVHEARASRARRLRWVADGSEVRLGLPLLLDEGATTHVALAPAIKERFHLFLSHVW